MTSVEDLAVDAPMAMSGVGDRLRAARESKGLTIADIAQTLKFSPRQVELVEGNAWSELPGQTFVRGCVRNYARMLELDPQPLLDDLTEANMPKAAVLSLPGSTNATLPVPGKSQGRDVVAVLAGLLLVAIAALAYFLVPEDLWRPKSDPAASQADSGRQAVPVVPPPSAVPAQAPGGVPATAGGAVAGTAAAAPASAADSVPASNALLRFEFDQASWVEVRDSNGNLLHSQNNAAGSFQEVNGVVPLSVVVGDARRVRMIYKDKPVDLAPFTNAQSNVARLVIE